MLTAGEFKRKWGSDLVRLKRKAVSGVLVPNDVIEFLTIAALPVDAAPFLSFDELRKGPKHIYEIWGRPDDYPDDAKKRLSPYLVIGSDGAGNPICLDTNNDCQVVHLDHEDLFDTRTFVNSSLPQLAESLLLVREMYETASDELSDDELSEAIPEKYRQDLFLKLEAMDPGAMADNAFWKPEASML